MTEKKEAAVETAEEPKKTTKAKAKKSETSGSKVNDIIESVKNMTVLELAELVKTLEEEFGVTASAPVVAAAAPGAGWGRQGFRAAPTAQPDRRSQSLRGSQRQGRRSLA